MKKSLLISVGIGVLAVGWIASGVLFPSSTQTHGPAPAHETEEVSNKTVQVRARDSVAESFMTHVGVTGKTMASRSVALKAEVEGQVQELLADKGAVVTEGQVIAKLDLRDRAARVTESKQLVNQRQIEFNAAKSLEKDGFYSKTRLAQAAADLESAKASLVQTELNLGKVEIKAPFDGIIGDRMVNVGDYATIGMPLFSVVDLDPLKLTGFVSERVVLDLSVGAKAHGTLLNGQAVEGELSFIAPAAQEATRTFPIEITLPNAEGKMVEGLTADIQIPTVDKPAHKISPAILTLNEQGQVGVKIVNDKNVVEFVPITILEDAPDYSWVSGLPEKARLITVGQDFVIPGQVVDPVISTNKEGLL